MRTEQERREDIRDELLCALATGVEAILKVMIDPYYGDTMTQEKLSRLNGLRGTLQAHREMLGTEARRR